MALGPAFRRVTRLQARNQQSDGVSQPFDLLPRMCDDKLPRMCDDQNLASQVHTKIARTEDCPASPGEQVPLFSPSAQRSIAVDTLRPALRSAGRLSTSPCNRGLSSPADDGFSTGVAPSTSISSSAGRRIESSVPAPRSALLASASAESSVSAPHRPSIASASNEPSVSGHRSHSFSSTSDELSVSAPRSGIVRASCGESWGSLEDLAALWEVDNVLTAFYSDAATPGLRLPVAAASPARRRRKKPGKKGTSSSSSRGAATSGVAAAASSVASTFLVLQPLPFERDSANSSVVSESTQEPPPRTAFEEWFEPLFEPTAPFAGVGSLDVRRFSVDLTIVLGRSQWDELLQQQLADGLCDDISFFGLSSYWFFHSLFNAAARVATMAWDLKLGPSPHLWDNFAALYGSDAPFAYFRLYVIELRSRAIQALTALVMTNDVPANVFLECLLDKSMYLSA